METYKIYKITNKINGHFYIGYTKLTIYKRFKLHSKATTNKMPIVSSIKKYGIDNFIIELLHEFDNKLDAINCEIRLSEEVKKVLSELKLGHTPWNKGKTGIYSDETLVKFKKPKTEEHKNKLKKQYTIVSPSGEKILILGLTEFCKNNNLNKGAMSEVWKGKRNVYKGWTK